jgi:hypothetical protein
MRHLALTLTLTTWLLALNGHAQAQFTQNAFQPTPPHENLPDRNAFTQWPQEPGNRPHPDRVLVFQSDFLIWALPVTDAPTITTGSTLDAVPGALGQPRTRTLLDGDENLNPFYGFRGVLTWMQPEYEIELNGFMLLQQSRTFSARSTLGGSNPLLAVALRNVTPPATGQEVAVVLATPGATSGTVTSSTSTQFWGLETNFYKPLFEAKCFGGGMIVGYRYLNLQDQVTLDASTSVPAAFHRVFSDTFETTNQFHGFQAGVRGSYKVLPTVTLDGNAKIALGVSAMESKIAGSTTTTFVTVPVVVNTPGGILAQSTNIGTRSSADFAYVSQGQLKACWAPVEWLHFCLGYELLFWSPVVRAGDQIDRNFNASRVTGPTAPSGLLNTEGLFAHGIFGSIEFAY